MAQDTECRAKAGDCDVAEACDGAALECPKDAFVAANTECRKVAGDCDVAEKCNGQGPACPADGVAKNDVVCRAMAGDCDVAEMCNGWSATCPNDGFLADGQYSTGDECSPYLCDGKVASCVNACTGNEDCVKGYACESNVCKVNVWINEIHYDDVDSDADEGVEVAGPAGTDLTGWTLVAYNGSDSKVIDTVSLSGTIPDQQGGKGTLWFAYWGLQNGAPDGIALVDAQGKVVQFLCYEGTMTAVDGPAKDVLCTDIGVAETSNTPDGDSLQLKGTGSKYADFTWDAPKAHTRGQVNTDQNLQ
ncbi:MAG: hypothetical protein HY744_11495 [Deltaproteobacteria bacterium]|nr:hypothetical protein [Deltaproteobacteria bacterium]